MWTIMPTIKMNAETAWTTAAMRTTLLETAREIRSPHDDPGDDQQGHRADHRPEQLLLADVVLVDRGQVVVAILDHVG